MSTFTTDKMTWFGPTPKWSAEMTRPTEATEPQSRITEKVRWHLEMLTEMVEQLARFAKDDRDFAATAFSPAMVQWSIGRAEAYDHAAVMLAFRVKMLEQSLRHA